MLSRSERTLQACNRRRLRTHALCNLSLSEPCVMPCLQKLIEEFAFLAFNAADFPSHTRTTEQL